VPASPCRLIAIYKELAAQHHVVTAWADTARDAERARAVDALLETVRALIPPITHRY
jgi:hypothetical protein